MRKIRIRNNPNVQGYFRILEQLTRLRLSYRKSTQGSLPGGVVDPQLARMLRVYSHIPRKTDLPVRTPLRARRIIIDESNLQKFFAPTHDYVASIKNLYVPVPYGTLHMCSYHPAPGKTLPVMVFFHGGGWVTGSPDTHDNLTRALAKHVPCMVLSVDYRLAPEHPFPAAVEDAYFALQWAAENASDHGGDPASISVCGDSAGGNLAAVVSQMARDKGGPALTCQVLFYAAVDLSGAETHSFEEFSQGYGLTRSEYYWYLQQYLRSPEDGLNPLASPMLAKDLSGLPPAYIVTAEFDILRDEGEEYARKLRQAGTAVNLRRENGMIHAFLSMIGVVDRADRAILQIAEDLHMLMYR